MSSIFQQIQSPLLISGAACGLAAQLLINLVTSAKYVCNDNSNSLIVGLKAIEWVVVAGAFGATWLALASYQESRKTDSNLQATLFYGCVLNGAVVFLALMTYIILHFTSGCSNCITQNSVDLATRGTEDSASPDIAAFVMETSKMTGADNTGTYIDNYLTPEWFQIPINYCRTTLQSIPGSTNSYSSSHAERCLAYSCTSLVPGSSAQEGIFYAACSLELAVCLLLAVQSMRSTNVKKRSYQQVPNSSNNPNASENLFFPSFKRSGHLHF